MSFPETIQVGGVVYRAEYVSSGLTAIGPGSDGSTTYVRYDKMQVIRVTPKGAWLTSYYMAGPYLFDQVEPAYRYWYSFGTRKYHYTKEGALENLKWRRLRYFEHCRRRMKEAALSLKHLGLDEPHERLQRINLGYDRENDWP